MARLPSRDDLGPPPSARSGRPIARVDTSAIGEGAARFGASLANLGNEIAAANERRQAFEAESKEQEFRWNEKLALDNAMRNVQPGQASSFADEWQAGFGERAKAFTESLPRQLRPFAEKRVFGIEKDLYGTALTFQREEQKRVSINSIDDLSENVWRVRARNVPTDQLDEVTADADRLINENPDLTPIEKDEKRREVFRNIGLSHLDSLPPEEVIDRVTLGGSFVDRVVGVESGGRANAKNPNSTATGLGQFIESTWEDFIRERHPELLVHGDDIQKFRIDRELSREAVQWYADKNAATLQDAGLPVDNGTLYLAHFAGPEGAVNLLTADPNASAESVLGSAVVKANPFLKGKTAQGVIEWAAKKMGGTAPTALSMLTDEDRQKALAGAIREQRRAYTEETERQQEAKEEITKVGYDLMLEDKLTPEWVEANRDIFNISDYKAFIKHFEPDSQAKRTPPKEYIRLLDLSESDPAQAIEEVRTLYGNDVIAKDVFNTVMSRARQNQERVGGRSYASELRTYVSTALTPDRDGPQWQYARKLDALFQFDDFLEKNENADRETIRKQAQGLIDDYRKIRYGTGVTTLPLPRFTLRTPETIDLPELQNAMVKTRGSLEVGMIDANEAAQQAAIIRRWMDVVRWRD